MQDLSPPPARPRPTVSVVTPAHDAASTIAETIASVRAQTFDGWELLVVDDASRDATPAIVAELAARDPRIVLIRLPENAGPAAARNAALAQARGRYVCFLDADDLWLPDKLARQLAFMEREDCAISCTAYRRMSADGARVGNLIVPPKRLAYDDLLKNTAIANLTAMVDQEKTGGFRLPKGGHEDYALWLSLLRGGGPACGLAEDLARYRVVGDSRSSRPLRSAAWVWRIYREQEKLSLLRSAWCLAHYTLHAALKRRTLRNLP